MKFSWFLIGDPNNDEVLEKFSEGKGFICTIFDDYSGCEMHYVSEGKVYIAGQPEPASNNVIEFLSDRGFIFWMPCPDFDINARDRFLS